MSGTAIVVVSALWIGAFAIGVVVIAFARHAIEADDAREAGQLRRRVERDAASHAEPEDEDPRRAAPPLQLRDGGGDVGLDEVRSRAGRRHVLLEREVVGPLGRPGGPSEVVDGDRVNPRGCEALRKVLIGAVEPADVGR